MRRNRELPLGMRYVCSSLAPGGGGEAPCCLQGCLRGDVFWYGEVRPRACRGHSFNEGFSAVTGLFDGRERLFEAGVGHRVVAVPLGEAWIETL